MGWNLSFLYISSHKYRWCHLLHFTLHSHLCWISHSVLKYHKIATTGSSLNMPKQWFASQSVSVCADFHWTGIDRNHFEEINIINLEQIAVNRNCVKFLIFLERNQVFCLYVDKLHFKCLPTCCLLQLKSIYTWLGALASIIPWLAIRVIFGIRGRGSSAEKGLTMPGREIYQCEWLMHFSEVYHHSEC